MIRLYSEILAIAAAAPEQMVKIDRAGSASHSSVLDVKATKTGTARWMLLIAVGASAYGGMVIVDLTTGTLRAGSTPTTIGLLFVVFASFVPAIWLNERRPLDTRLLWLVAVSFRLLMGTTQPTLSDDVYRYLWDGHLVTEGVNPYSYAIDAPQLDGFDSPTRRMANNVDLSSPYLPVAQGVFAASVATLPSSPRSLQLVMTAFDLATAWVVSRLLVLTGQPARRLMLYLWNPLMIVEIAHGAHLDAVMTFLAVVAFWATLAAQSESRRRWGLVSPVALALATLTRPIPVLLAPVLWWRWSVTHRVAFAVTLVAAVVPFSFGNGGWGLLGPPTGVGVFGSARVYSQEFRFNAGVSRWLEDAFGQASVAASTLTGGAMAALLLGVWVAARRSPTTNRQLTDRRLLRLAAVPMVGYIVLTPVFHPWYLMVLMTLLVFVAPSGVESRDRWLLLLPWVYLSAASSLSYLTYRDPAAFAELDWVRAIQWFPTLALLLATSFWVFFAVQAEPPYPRDESALADASSDTGSS